MKTKGAATQWLGGLAWNQIAGCHLHSCRGPSSTTSHISGDVGRGWEGGEGWGGLCADGKRIAADGLLYSLH